MIPGEKGIVFKSAFHDLISRSRHTNSICFQSLQRTERVEDLRSPELQSVNVYTRSCGNDGAGFCVCTMTRPKM